MPRRPSTLIAVLAAAALPALVSPPSSALSGGPDVHGYTYVDSTESTGPAGGPFTSIAPADGGHGLDTGTRCDDCRTTYALPFAITVYDTTARQVAIDANGYLALLDDAGQPTSVSVNGLGRDLTTEADGLGVFTRTVGAVGHRTVTFEWKATDYLGEVDEQFQIVLHEDRPEIDMRYLDVTDDGSARVGLDDYDESGFELFYDGAVTDDLAIRFDREVEGSATRARLRAAPGQEAVHGQTVRLTVNVVPVESSADRPTGSVTFFDGATEIGTALLRSNGKVTIGTASLGRGFRTLRARYSGDDTYAPSVTAALPYYVQAGNTTLSVSARSVQQYGDEGVLARVTPVAPARGTPSGYVYWFDDDTGFVAFTDLTKGRTTLPTRYLVPGEYHLHGLYQGDGLFEPSTSSTIPLTVTKLASALTLSASPSPATAGTRIALTAKVKAAPNARPPQGEVVFRAGDQEIGSAKIVEGTARLVRYQGLAAGHYTLTATYEGDPYVAGGVATTPLTVT